MASIFLQRRDKIRKYLKKCQIQAFLVTEPVNVRYLSGFTGGDSFLIVKPDGDLLISDSRFSLQIAEESPALEVLIRDQSVSLVRAVTQTLGRQTFGILGVESRSVTLALQRSLEAALTTGNAAHWKIAPIDRLVEELREIKDRGEIAKIRKAIDAAHQAFWDVRKNLSPGDTEVAIRNALDYRMCVYGGEERSFPTIVGAGPRAALPHAIPSEAVWDAQSHLLIDWGCFVQGYASDLTRVLLHKSGGKQRGKLSEKKLRKIYETVLKAQQAAIHAIKPGKTGAEIHKTAEAVIKDAGFGKFFTHGLGHGLGLAIHEAPRLAPAYEKQLKPGMVVTVEPGIYLTGQGGIRIEDDILITRTGCEVLSQHVPREFDEMFV